MAHWLMTVARTAGLNGVGADALDPATPVTEAWQRVVEWCGVSESDLARSVAQHFHCDVADLTVASAAALKLVPDVVARRHHVFPVRETDREIVVATSNPTDLDAEQALGFTSGRKPVFEIATPKAIAEAIESRYSPEGVVEGLLRNVEAEEVDRVALVGDLDETETVTSQDVAAAPVVKLTNLILREAVLQGASDVHIEPGRSGGTVRFRIDGVMRQYMTMPMPALNRVVSRIKIQSGLDIADRLRPQDGRARIRVAEATYDLRISTVPTRSAEKAVIRILDPEGSLRLASLGLSPHEEERALRLIGHRDGIVLVTGPTGSGKTTTLYAALQELATGQVNIMTVEDPVEYDLPGTTQIQVERRRGVTFASALRAILRQDPDVILVGEIRDLETAEVAVQASLTGHLVLATLHANDAVSTITRLEDLGLDRTAIAQSLRGAVAQRLARRVCPDCAERVRERPSGPAPEGGADGEDAARAVGCERCGHTGFRGRLALMEVAVVTPDMAQLIEEGGSGAALRQAALEGGMRPMREAALDRVRDGATTLAEIDRVLGETSEGDRADVPEQPRVLLVDDDAVVRAMARSLLEKQGYRIAEAGDGAEALEVLKRDGAFELMVLDLDMPNLGGRDVLRQVRRSVATAGLPVVVLTGTENSELEVRLIEEGADDYIRKPIDPPRFVARIKAALRRAGPLAA